MIPRALVSRLIYPLHERLKGKRTLQVLADLEQTQWLAPDKLRELAFRRLKTHLEWAYQEAPYYRRLLDEHGLPPARIASFDDFAKIPPLTRDILRSRLTEVSASRRLPRVRRLTTGGSTGMPVAVLVDAARAAFTDAARLRAHNWFGAGIGAREVVLWGSPIELGRQDRLRTLRDFLINSRLLSAFDMGEQALARYAALIRQWKPEKLYGYASALALLAGFLSRLGWEAPDGWPRAVFTTAEPLYEFQRTTIQSVFRCPVSVEYGSRDAGLVANECPAGGFHVCAEGILVETTPDGEILVTNFDSWALPIIRYRTGDVGKLEPRPCPCGRGLPLLRNVEGRRTDFLVTPSGRVLHALAAIYVLREIPEVNQFQVVQERLDRLVVRVRPEGSRLPPEACERIIKSLGRLFEGKADILVEEADRLTSPSGKHRYVVSHVADQTLAELGWARTRH